MHLWGSAPSPTEGITKKDKWLSEEALQITVQIIEMKGKGEKERCNHMNAEFQRVRREKRASSEIKEKK